MQKPIETGRITGIASEGQGIIRHDGLVVFIPFTTPGDKVRYRITRQKKNFALGVLQEVLEPSPQRTIPLCPYFGTCGGCQLQHMRYDAQLSNKRQWVEDALNRIGGLKVEVPPVVPSHAQWSYRRRISLVLRPHHGSYETGYIATDNKTLIAIATCPIFANLKDPIVAAIQSLSNQLEPNGKEEGKATILKCSNTKYLVHFHFKKMPENLAHVCQETIDKHPFLAGILASSAGQTLQFGTLDTSIEVDGLQIDISPKAFVQSHPGQSLNIYQAIDAYASECKPKKTLDLYCGVGITSLLLARQGIAVTGIESNPEAIRLALDNARKNKQSHAKFITADVANVLEETLQNETPDFVVVNPPREGLDPRVLQALAAHPIKTLVYVSCMPSTLARDLKHLCEHGYAIDNITAFDMFPQTIHVETLVKLRQLPIR